MVDTEQLELPLAFRTTRRRQREKREEGEAGVEGSEEEENVGFDKESR